MNPHETQLRPAADELTRSTDATRAPTGATGYVDFDGLDIPVLTGLQAQGDLLVQPVGHRDKRRPLVYSGPDGIAVLRGEHPHVLVGDPDAFFYCPLDSSVSNY